MHQDTGVKDAVNVAAETVNFTAAATISMDNVVPGVNMGTKAPSVATVSNMSTGKAQARERESDKTKTYAH